MANPLHDSGTIAGKVIIGLLGVASLFMLGSIITLTYITHNFYVANYYTFSALLDATGVGTDALINAVAPQLSQAFYAVVVVSVLDGLAKAVIIGFVMASFINFLTGIDIKSGISGISVRHMKDHIMICGYSNLGERLAREMMHRGSKVVIVEKDTEKANNLRDLGFTVINGDFTDRKVLTEAAVDKARAIVFTGDSDFINLMGIVSAHSMNPNASIIARARQEDTLTKMQRGGAGFCIVPEVAAGMDMGATIAKVL
ncbi:MAG TPA: NAD(P)-binding protein [Candidatus Acidoferrales bacterium]|nr:NAD(P)-binding protein [Candidatus Acidoferrales bacterium]